VRQKLYLEYFSVENQNRPYYLDTQTMVSQWDKPLSNAITEAVIMNGLEVNERLGQWLKSSQGQSAVMEKVISSQDASKPTSV